MVLYYYNALIIEDVKDSIPFLKKEKRQYRLAIRGINPEVATNFPEISREYVIESTRNPETDLTGQASNLQKPQEGAP